jgi:hypothetical protein
MTPFLRFYDVNGVLLGSAGGAFTYTFTSLSWVAASLTLPGTSPAGTAYSVLHLNLALPIAESAWIDAVEIVTLTETVNHLDGSITTAKLAAGAVDSAALGSGAVASKTQFGAGMVGTQKGTSNPASPSTNDRNVRTDIERDAYWNGTYWVTPDVKMLPFDAPHANTATTTNNDNVGRIAHNGDLDWLLYRFAAAVFVATTNNASNYWTLTLRYITAGNTVTAVTTVTTAAIAANVWNRIATNTFSPVTAPATAFMLEVIASTTGAPGSLLVVPQLMIREIMP